MHEWNFRETEQLFLDHLRSVDIDLPRCLFKFDRRSDL